MSKFFIDRPIFAWVIALVIMLAGGLSILSLPVNQYPAIAPPAIAVQVSYPGASAETVQDTVVQVIEQQMNGIDNLRYISSESNSDGSMTITVTFEQGTDPDIAQVQVQNKLQLATPLLPQGAAPGDPGDQGGEELPHGGRCGFHRRQHDQGRPVELHRFQHPGPARGPRASVTSRCSARSTRCASGSTRPS